MNLAGLPAKEYCKPTGIPIVIIVIVGLIGVFLAYGAAESVNSFLDSEQTLNWFSTVQFVILLIAGALAGYLISAKSRMHLAGVIAGASALVVGSIIVQIINFALVVPRLRDIAAGLIAAGVEGADAITAFGTTEMLIALLLTVGLGFILGAVTGLVGQVIGNSRRA